MLELLEFFLLLFSFLRTRALSLYAPGKTCPDKNFFCVQGAITSLKLQLSLKNRLHAQRMTET